jgi:hypothetical protein
VGGRVACANVCSLQQLGVHVQRLLLSSTFKFNNATASCKLRPRRPCWGILIAARRALFLVKEGAVACLVLSEKRALCYVHLM